MKEILLIAIIVFLSFAWFEIGKKSIIQNICEKQTYDFCKVEKTFYKLKEFKE